MAHSTVTSIRLLHRACQDSYDVYTVKMHPWVWLMVWLRAQAVGSARRRPVSGIELVVVAGA